jgi:histidinol-phosphate aminotransferase
MEGYVPGEQPRDGDYIKLNTNENPYPPSPRVLAALRRAANGTLRLYPEPSHESLRKVAASLYGVEVDEILCGNGSDELLSIVTRCFLGAGDRVAYPAPTYSLYDTLVAIQEGIPAPVDYARDFLLPEALASQQAAVTFLCNPNSPSGTLAPLSEVEKLAGSVSGILVVDEAYIDFADIARPSAIPLIRKFPNLVVLRTFSNSFSLAGMRVGLAFAREQIISGMLKVKDSYNLNRLSLAAAAAALEDLPWMLHNVGRIQKTRARLTRELKKIGFTVLPSQANFVMARRPGENLKELYLDLKRRRILVRYFDRPELQDSLRITIGTPAEIKTLSRELEKIFAGSN